MRTFILKIILLPISLLAACGGKSREVRDFIPGTYVNHAQSAYSIADDTLVIKADALTENGYQLTRRTGFSRVLNGQLQATQHKTKVFTAVWDEAKQTLQITQNGLIILFQPGGHQLEIANSKYRKL
ncbi:hypothetical protein [Mucilaginibacter sp. dw_454]|uniref:hypothetical protein n=1 Tax=Mucilaginibacter sp. dw_454 TaxID=2720079 RepID=UPI001BD38333|nr:hypothetical protein [Mucilaginibacter sp. dw_454]